MDRRGVKGGGGPLYHLEKGNFHGHPSALVWDERWPEDKDPLHTYREDLEAYNKHRNWPSVQIPHSEMNRSAGEPYEIPKKFPHFPGQMLLPDNNSKRITRIMLEKINGKFQGACTHFLDGGGLRSGNHRIRFSSDQQQIYVGQTVRGWGKEAEGLQRITPTSNEPFDITAFNITPKGFKITFTRELEKELAAKDLKFKSFTYQSKWTYGSPQENKTDNKVQSVNHLDVKTIEVTLDKFKPDRVYQLDLEKIKSKDGAEIQNRLFYYTANQLP